MSPTVPATVSDERIQSLRSEARWIATRTSGRNFRSLYRLDWNLI
jgi:hypothetical protein